MIFCSQVLNPCGIVALPSAPVDTAQDIRRANLRLLLQEVAQDIGTERGAAAELARRTKVPAPMISQLLGQKLHQGGKVRAMGDDTARKLERGMNLPKGWMDVAHDSALTEGDRETLQALRALTPSQRSLIERQIAEFARLNGPPSATPPEQGTGKPLAH